LDMFCALKGATDSPRFLSQAQMAVVIQLLPAFDDVPPTNSDRAIIRDRPSGRSPRVVSSSTQHHAGRVPGRVVGRSRDASNQPDSLRLVQVFQPHARRAHRGRELLWIAGRVPGIFRVDDEPEAVQRRRGGERVRPWIITAERNVRVTVRDQDG
jgi:hypothetical protein